QPEQPGGGRGARDLERGGPRRGHEAHRPPVVPRARRVPARPPRRLRLPVPGVGAGPGGGEADPALRGEGPGGPAVRGLRLDRHQPPALRPPPDAPPASGERRFHRGAPLPMSARDLPAAIQWYEGMLLAPQHFQQSSLRQEALLAYHLAALSPYHWGVSRLD